MTVFRDEKAFSASDVPQAEIWLEEEIDYDRRTIFDVIKELNKDIPSSHMYCCELIWTAKKIIDELERIKLNETGEREFPIETFMEE